MAKLEKVTALAKAHTSGGRNNSASRISAIKTMASRMGNIPTRFTARYQSSFRLCLVGICILAGAFSALSAGLDVLFPDGFRDWFFVNSLTAPAESTLFGHVGGMHHIYVNAKGLSVLKTGGPFPYPDGTIFADDVHDFSVKDSASLEGAKKFVTVMVKDAKKYEMTGGWGFQVWAGGDPSKPLVPDLAHSVQACFVCHTPQKAQDYVFSTYIP